MRTKFATLRLWFITLFGGMAIVGVLRGATAPASPDVLVAANTTTIPDRFRPTPGNPIYYVFAQTQQSFGTVVAGVKLPSPATVESAIVAELSKQGFVRAKIGGPNPSIRILAVVGDANFIPLTEEEVSFYQRVTSGKDGLAAWEAVRNNPRLEDQMMISTILGVAQAQTLSSAKKDRLAMAGIEDRYYVTVIAFDAALMAKKEKCVLWRTTMSIAFNNDFELTLPTMLASGGPFFGHDLKEPEFIGDNDRRKAEVQIGELSVVPDDQKDSKQSKK